MENKNNISKEDFLKLLSADSPLKTEHLDDFEKEALEGLKLMKNPSMLNSIDEKIDTKLTELIADEKKGTNKFGLYFLSIAASMVLLVGLFFLFKQADKDDKAGIVSVNDNRNLPEKELDERVLNKVNSDGKLGIEEEKNNVEQKTIDVLASGEGKKSAEKNIQFDNTQSTQGLRAKKSGEYGEINYREKSSTDETVSNTVSDGFFVNRNEANPPVSGESVVLETTTKSKQDLIHTPQPDVESAKKQEETYTTQDQEDKTKLKASVLSKKEESKKSSTEPPTDDNVVTVKKPMAKEVVVPSPPATLNGSIQKNKGTTTSISSDSNNNTGTTANSTTYTKAEFIGGQQALDAYIKTNLKIPESCTSEEVIIVRITISQTGEVSKPKILSKTGNCSDCEKEAIAFVKQMPKWKPATNKGNTLVSTQQVELHFKK